MSSAPSSVLVIDDDANDQFIAKYQLEKRWPGVEVLQALDGQEAIEILDTRLDDLPDLLLLDINMPRLDGHGFLETWCRSRNRTLPIVVMLTSSNQTTDRERTRVYPTVREYLVKPLDRENIGVLERVHLDRFDTADSERAA